MFFTLSNFYWEREREREREKKRSKRQLQNEMTIIAYDDANKMIAYVQLQLFAYMCSVYWVCISIFVFVLLRLQFIPQINVLGIFHSIQRVLPHTYAHIQKFRSDGGQPFDQAIIFDLCSSIFKVRHLWFGSDDVMVNCRHQPICIANDSCK